MQFFANPYNTGATGFYFETQDEYQEKSSVLVDSCGYPVEEFMIDVIDGEQAEVQLANAIGVNQCNIAAVIEYLDEGKEHEWPAMFFLMNDLNMTFEEAKEKVDDVSISECSLLDAATELFDECYLCEIPKESRDFIGRYIDYEAFSSDCQMGGDMVEFEFAGTTYTCTNASGL
jgi:hypothetical protein